MKYLVIVFLFVLASCGSKTAALPTKTAEPTETAVAVSTETPSAVSVADDENFLIFLNEKTFIPNLEFLINELLVRDLELGEVLLGCDVAISYSPTAEDLKIIGESINGKSNCAIALVREEDYSTSDSIWKKYDPVQPTGRSLVASVVPIGDSNFPLLVIPEGHYDAEYFIRVLGHEAFHVIQLLQDTSCPDTAEKSCKIKEEVSAFQRQFELLDLYLVKTDQISSYEENGLLLLPGSSDINRIALMHEYVLYFLNKDGTLYEFLYDNNYGN